MLETETLVRKAFLPFALSDVGETEIAEVAAVLRSGWLTTGPRVKKLETEVAAYVGAKHAVAVNSCTAAMHLALEAIGLESGDEVITTTYTFAATAEVVRYFGARPVLVDVDPTTLCIDPAKVEAAVTSRTRAIIPVHIAGLAAAMDDIRAIAAPRGLKVVEDAAHALPTKYKGRMVGTLSEFTCFSFYATKTLTTGEGGMICTDNEAWAEHCRVMSLHGISRDAWKRYSAEGSWYYEIASPGFKYNLTDIAAAMGLVQLRKANRMRERRAQIAGRYTAAFQAIPELEPPPEAPADGQHAWHLYMLRLDLDRLSIGRAQFIEELKRLSIGTSVHFIPLHLHPYYRETYGYKPEDFPVAYREYQREVSLPIYSKMTDGDVQDVIDAVADTAGRYRSPRWPSREVDRRHGWSESGGVRSAAPVDEVPVGLTSDG
jgi:dTDP-4-amino-4,6-dideoxygalactose transaminase